MRNLKLGLASSAVAVALSASAAHAQSFDWSGAYAGFTLGGALNADTRFDQTTGELPNNDTALSLGLRPTEATVRDSASAIGVQLGFNRQFGPVSSGVLVMGVEADISATDLDRTLTSRNVTNYGPMAAPSATPVSRVNEYQSETDYIATLRARAGVAFDRLYVYGTAGVAHGRVDRQITFYGPNADTTPFFQGSEGGGRTGHVYGAGFEYAVSPGALINVFNSSGATVKLEYLHYDLGDDTIVADGVNGGATLGSYTARVSNEGDLFRGGFNYKF